MEHLPVNNVSCGANNNSALLQVYHQALNDQIQQIRTELSQTETIKSEFALKIVDVLAEALEKVLVLADALAEAV